MLWVGRDLEYHLVLKSFYEQEQFPPDKVVQGPIQPGFVYFKGWGIHNPSINQFQCLTTLTAEDFFLIHNLHLSYFIFLVLPIQALVKIPSPALLQAAFRD